MNNRIRFPELDLLRFLAACAVMLFHYTFRASLDHAWSGSFPVLSQISKYGYLGVHLFFLLSGFVILLTASHKDAVGFCFARMIRLYPAYWICVTLSTLTIFLAHKSHSITLPQYLTNLSLLQSFVGIRDISGVYWTLAMELKFYFLIFLILLLRQISRIRYWLGIWLVASLVLSLQPPHGIARFFLFPEWSSYFIAGAMFYLIHREGPSAYKLAIILGCYGLSLGYALNLLPTAAGHGSFEVNFPVVIGAIGLFYLVFLALALKPRAEPHSNSFYRIGLLTYPLYLLHQDIGYLLLHLAPSGLNRFLVLSLVSAVAIGLASLILIPERWIARRLKAFLARLQRSAAYAPASRPALLNSAPSTTEAP
ncbi:MAG TPA: acyltransferase [Candidatus Limnocylindrales bacterium]|nr:acyltransferase [Candidatus Limnocylindrales bacterium]